MINHNPTFVFESVHALVSHAGNAETDRVEDLDPSAKNGAACRTRVSKPWKPETDLGASGKELLRRRATYASYETPIWVESIQYEYSVLFLDMR